MFVSGLAAALLSLFVAVYFTIGDAAGGEWSIWGWGSASIEVRQDGPVGSCSLGGPSAEAVTSKTRTLEEAQELRTRRTHWGRPNDNPGVTCLPRSPFVEAN